MQEFMRAVAYLAAGFAIGIGTFGPAISQGLIGSRACENIGKYPESMNKIQTMAFVAMAMVETGLLFLVLTVVMIIFTAKS